MRPVPRPRWENDPAAVPSVACAACTTALARTGATLAHFAHGVGQRALVVACACDGRVPTPLFSYRGHELIPAASIVKLAWVLAAMRAHRQGGLDLTVLRTAGDVGTSAFRDGLAPLPPDTVLPWVVLVGLGLVTSANPVFDNLTRTPGLAERVEALGVDVVVTSGFSDDDLRANVRTNLITAEAAGSLLAAVLREATDDLAPVYWGLVNGARTTRLVRDADDQPGLPDGFCAPNKTGSLRGVRNDVAAFCAGEAMLVVAALSAEQPASSRADVEMAELATEVVAARWLVH